MRPGLPSSMLAASLLVLCALPAPAQVWSGLGELELRVRADRGGAVAGAVVSLEFLGSRPAAGPAPVRTDASGRASVSGLAEGSWQLEVSHPDFLTYVARIDLTIGRKVEELGVAQRSDGEGTGLFRIRFERVRRGEAPPTRRDPGPSPRPAEAEVTETSPEPPPATKVDRPPAAATEPSPEPGEAATEEPGPSPDSEAPIEEERVPEPTEPPAPAPEPAEEILPEEVPEPEPAEEVFPELPEPEPTESPAPDAPTPPVAPEPAEEILPDEIPDPEPAAPPVAPVASETAPRPLARVHTARDGTCPDCRPGESALSADVTAAPGAGRADCPAEAGASVERAFERLAEATGDGLQGFHGPLVDPGLRDLLSLAPPALRESVLEALRPLVSEGSSCRVVAILLPNDTRLGGFRYEARDVEQVADCLPDRECPLPGARWHGNPGRLEAGGRILVWALFSNDSPHRERHGRLTVYLQ